MAWLRLELVRAHVEIERELKMGAKEEDQSLVGDVSLYICGCAPYDLP